MDSGQVVTHPFIFLMRRQLSAEQIRSTIEHIPVAISFREGESVTRLTERVRMQFQELVVGTDKLVDTISRILDWSAPHSEHRYKDAELYGRVISGRLPESYWSRAADADGGSLLLIFGPPGVGKTAVRRSLSKLLKATRPAKVKVGALTEILYRPVLEGPLLKGATPKQCLDSFRAAYCDGQALSDLELLRNPDPLAALRCGLYRSGAQLVIPDELQFVMAQKGSSSPQSLLLQMRALDVPTVAISNTDLVWRLHEAPGQVRDRLLQNWIHISPYTRGSEDWRRLKLAYLSQSPLGFDAGLESDAEADNVMYGSSRGVARHLQALVVCAIRLSLESRLPLSTAMLKTARCSREFAVSDVGVKLLSELTPTSLKKRKEYWPPFAAAQDDLRAWVKEIGRKAFTDAERRALWDAMTDEERAANPDLRPPGFPQPKATRRQADDTKPPAATPARSRRRQRDKGVDVESSLFTSSAET